MAAAFAVPAQAAHAQPLRVLSYNIQGNLNANISLASIASVISGQNPDVIGLQEVCEQQIADLQSRLPAYAYARHAHTVTTSNPKCVKYGIAILSKLPLADYAQTELPSYNERRFVQSATITAGGIPFRFYNTHTSPGAGATHMNAVAAETDKPAPERKILTCDCNVEQDDPALNGMWARSFTEADWSTNTPTHPSDSPSKKIDFVFLGGAVAGGATQVVNTQASDHRPLRADVTLVTPPARTPTRIVFESARTGGGDIYRAAPDGTSLRRLTTNGAQDSDPVASPDGSQIAFVSRRDGNAEIYVMNADGEAAGLRRVTSNGTDDLEPTWSPDGQWIAYRATRNVNGDNNNEIYKIRADGTGDTRLTNNAASDFAPDWSPKGGTIAFQRHTSGVGNEVFTMSESGAGQANRTNNDGPNDGRPAFSPDGQKLAFHSDRAGVSFEIFTMDAGGANVVRRTATRADEQEPVWSPDGSQIAFRSDRAGSNDVFTGDIVGGVFTSGFRVTSDGASDDSPDWYRDTRAPQTTLTADGAAFTFTRDEAEGAFECSLDEAPFTACASPQTPSGLADGSHTFAVRAVDWAGNRDATPATRTFVVDAVQPAIAITSAPPALGTNPRPTLHFTATGATSVTCAVDGADPAPCASPLTLGPLADGDHTVVIRGADGEGNVASDTAAFATDTTAPALTITAQPPALGRDPSPRVAFDTDGAATCALDGAAPVPCVTPYAPGRVADGDHTLVVRSADRAGNATERTVTFTVDTTPPQTTLSTIGSPLADPTPELTFGGGATYECRLDTTTWSDCTSPYTTSHLADGSHTFAVRAFDAAGNVDPAPATATFVVDTLAPTLTIDTAPPALANDPTPSVAFHASEVADATCALDGGTPQPCTSPHTLAPVADGEHALVIAAVDRAGHAAAPQTLTFRVDTRAPVITVDAAPPALGSDPSPTVAFSVEEDATTTCALDGGAPQPCTSPYTTPALADGDHVLVLAATDAAGNPATPRTIAFATDATAPVVTLTTGPSGATDDPTPSLEFTSDDPAATFACAVDGGAFASCTAPFTTAALAPGAHVVRVRATDAAGNVSAIAERAFAVNFPPSGGEATPAPAPPAPPAPPKTFVVGFDEYKSAPGASSSSQTAAVALVTRSATPDRRGRIRLTLLCRVACRGTLKVGTAKATYRAAKGRRVTVTVTLDRATRARLARAKKALTVPVTIPGFPGLTVALHRR